MVYLKSNIKAEPLIWQWYAWPHLIPPINAGCNIAERHLRIMQSYIQNPWVHAQAIKDPRMIGGPFIDLDGQKIDEVKDLIARTKHDCEDLIALNDAYKKLDQILQTEAIGDSMNELYDKVPKALEGLVELVYDLNNHPSIRIIEPLVYSKYYSAAGQKIALSESVSDYRKFVLSTPRLDDDKEICLDVPFTDPRLDVLFKMKVESKNLEEIKDLFSIAKEKQKIFESFFTAKLPGLSSNRNYSGEGVRIRYLGHACILIETKSVSILFDPVISYPNYQGDIIDRYTILDLPDKIDYVIITHNHQDHMLFETLLQLRYKISSIVFPSSQIGSLLDPSIKLILKHIGFKSLIELKEIESIDIPGGQITALPFLGEHSDLNIQSKLTYNIRLKNKNLLFAADSNIIQASIYDYIFKDIGKIDLLFLGMECAGAPLTWLYGPLLTTSLKRSYDNNRSLSGSKFEKAWLMAQKSNCSQAYVYAMGQEPWLNYIMALKYEPNSPQMVESDKFIKACIKRGIVSERLFGKKEWLLRGD
jgi:L-ascorbate metabolism protein UlaG (beta-lactamase superfamily)